MDITKLLESASKASKQLLKLTDGEINNILEFVANAIVANTDVILAANRQDLARMEKSNPKYDRLLLSADRIAGIAADMRNVATLPSPRRTIDKRTRPNGLIITRESVPFGVIGVIYEARPNVTADVFGLCFKSCNACVLKGGSDAAASNEAIVMVIKNALENFGIDTSVITLLPATREATDRLLEARGLVDLIIPRGSSSLIKSVREKSKVPVIETGAGVCHCFIDASADTKMAQKLVNNAKTRRVSVCNALDCMLIHRDRLIDLPEICVPLADSSVVIYADSESKKALEGNYPSQLLRDAVEESFGTEFLSYTMAIRTVDNISQAIDHISHYGSGHSESIITTDEENAAIFRRDIDAACVYVNAPTSFTDGAQFGLGAEIGISTQKLHARGPMALDELMTYKWLIDGNGQIRSK